MKPSLTVFLCSTFSDLVEEREAVLEAVRKLQLQHDSMEFFGARPDVPLKTCVEEVRKSDILVVVVGHRYGSLVPGLGISFSEAEYEEGFRLGKPCLIYMRDDGVPVLPRHIENDPDKLRQLFRWKGLLHERHTVAHFSDGKDLAKRVAVDLSHTMQAVEGSDQSHSTGLTASDIKELLAESAELHVSREFLLTTIRRAMRAAATSSTTKPRVFLCHSHPDTKIVQEVAGLLRAKGVDVWLDLLRGENSPVQSIQHGLDSSDFVAYFISKASLSSGWTQLELILAMRRQIIGQGQAILLPILLEDVEIPGMLRNVAYFDLRDRDAERAVNQLLTAIDSHRTDYRVAASGIKHPRKEAIRVFLILTWAHETPAQLGVRALQSIPEVVEIVRTYGEADFVAIVAVEDFQRINVIVETISNIPGIKTISPLIGTQ